MTEVPNGHVSQRRYELFVDIGKKLFPEYSSGATPYSALCRSQLGFTLGQWEELKVQVDAYFASGTQARNGERPVLDRRKTVLFARRAIEYVRSNTNIRLPSGFPAKFYDEIMNRLGL